MSIEEAHDGNYMTPPSVNCSKSPGFSQVPLAIIGTAILFILVLFFENIEVTLRLAQECGLTYHARVQ